MTHSLLACFAHPDDEAFGTGGTLARYAAEGVEVSLVCATRGEAGEISNPDYATRENLGEVREGELRCAAESIGVRELIFLDYRDSGMGGTPENDHPRAFMRAPAEEVVPQLVQIMRRLRPEAVVTFEPSGGYGHPDHIAIHRHTVAAFQAAADPNRYPELGPAWQAKRLFYNAIPRSFFKELRSELAALGQDLSDFDLFDDEDAGWPDEDVNVVIDVSATVDAKWSALNCHRTQFGPENIFRRLPEDKVRRMMGREFFALAWPAPPPGLTLESLFSSLPAGPNAR